MLTLSELYRLEWYKQRYADSGVNYGKSAYQK